MVAFTPAEYRRLLEVAGGEPIGTYIRRIMLRHLDRASGRRSRKRGAR